MKNRDTNEKRRYDSLDAWLVAHPDLPLTADTSRGSGVIIGSDTNGFNYPREKHEVYLWVQWCYSMLCEGAPHLLKNENLKVLYNRMTELVSEQKDALCHYFYYRLGPNSYCPKPLNWELSLSQIGKMEDNNITGGYPGYFKKNGHYNNNLTPSQLEIIETFKKIVEIIKPDLEPYIKKKKDEKQKKYIIAKQQRTIKHLQKKVHEFEERIRNAKNYIIQLNKDNEAL